MAHQPDDDAAPTDSLAGFTATGSSDAFAETMAADSGGVDGDDAPAGELRRGTKIGRYVIDGVLGAGGMGVVYRARDPALDRALAIKVLRPRRGGSAGRARLLREAQAMARLRHSNVVPIFDVGPTGDGVFVVMPHLEGGTLGAWVRASPRPWREIVARFATAGRGLAAAHAAGLVHRDFKPENVLLDADGEVAVADFGLARIDGDDRPSSGARRVDASNDLTHTGDVLGTPAYMAPEQMRGEASDARADQFSFCVALWEALFGRRPFDAGAERGAAALRVLLEQINAGTHTPPTTGRDVPAWLRAATERGLRADPATRWPSMSALLDALGGPRRRRGRMLGVAGLAVVAGGVAIALASSGGASSPNVAVDAATAAGPTRVRIDSLSSRGDIEAAALSPDGKQLAMIAGGRLLVRAPTADAEDTVLAEGIESRNLDWSPDGTRLLVSRQLPVSAQLVLIDVATHAEQTLPFEGMTGGFSAPDELVVAYVNLKEIYWRSVAGDREVRCEIPGDYTWIDRVDGVDADTVALTMSRESKTWLLVVGRDCRIRSTIAPEHLGAAHVRYGAGEILTIAFEGDAFTIQSWSPDGVALGPARTGRGDVIDVDGRLGERDLVLTRNIQTIVVRDRGDDPPATLLTARAASFALSDAGDRIAWIEDAEGAAGGVLRVDTLDRVDLRAGKLRDNVLSVAWSPDGTALAMIVDRGGKPAVERLVLATGVSTPIPLDDVDGGFAPVWLDDHRVAALVLDHTTYAWIDLDTGARGDVTDRRLGWTFSLLRSRRDGSLAFAWNRGAGLHLWTHDHAGFHDIAPIAQDESPALDGDGSLLLYNVTTGVVDRVDPATGARRPAFRQPLAPSEQLLDVIALPYGDHLANILRTVSDVAIAVPE